MRDMETTRDVRDREAYIPSDADPDRERYWPPESRAMAIEWAREQRLRERALAVDDATLGRVGDAIMNELARPQGDESAARARPPGSTTRPRNARMIGAGCRPAAGSPTASTRPSRS